MPVDEVEAAETRSVYAKVNSKHVLGLLTWPLLLGILRRQGDSAGNLSLVNDIDQLRGLCDRMDSQSFTPLRSEEVSAEIGGRVQQYARLVDDLVAAMVQSC